MGHIAQGKDVFEELGRKIDGLGTRAPFNDTFYEILKELYTPDEAELVVRMPYGLSTVAEISEATKISGDRLKGLLDGLCNKGLVMDLWLNDEYRYSVSPMVIGIFEFTMMRVGEPANSKRWAKLFERYMCESDAFYAANFGHGEQLSVMRTVPHEQTLREEAYLEILDYERAESIIRDSEKCAIGICSCRHEKQHNGTQACDTPLEMCSTFNYGADYMIRRNLAKEVSTERMLANLAEARHRGLVLNADNVKKNVTFMCFCCKCCCNALAGISKHGYANAVVTSNYIAEPESESCTGCGKCARLCPVDAIEMVPVSSAGAKMKKRPKIDESLCLGCGVCSLKCPAGSMKLTRREKRVIVPETTFQKIILAGLERGTLQNQLFSNPDRLSHKFLRAFVGGFLRLPAVKRALMSDTVRSRFLSFVEKGARKQGKSWAVDL